jgi:hypothetical protein
MALAVWTEPALARSYLNCLTKKVVIVEAPRGSTSSSNEESLGFWIDEAAETVVLADGSSLTVRRFDARWISAARGDMSYELMQNCSRSGEVSRLHASQLAFLDEHARARARESRASREMFNFRP